MLFARHPCVVAGQGRRIELVPLIRFASSLLAPPHCAVCGAPCPVGSTACGRCVSALGSQRTGCGRVGSVAVTGATAYEGVGRELVTSLKFRGRLELARLAGGAVAEAIRAAGLGGGCRAVVPVPAAPLRRRRRGFDPGELIAAAVAVELGAPLLHCLVRGSGRRQVGRGRAARLADPPRVRLAERAPEAALLVDDVLTTGATLGACAAALRTGGCREVTAAVFARALGPGGPGA